MRVGVVNPSDRSPGEVITLQTRQGDVVLRLEPRLAVPEEVAVVNLRAELESRRTGSLLDEGLTAATVLFIGGGSLGSSIAVSVAEAGVGELTIVDKDSLDASNIQRHACDLADLGRSKAVALADAVRRRGAAAVSREADILALGEEELDGLVRDADLTIATTDSPAAQFVVNEACVRSGRPAVFAGAYERACGGEVIAVRPGETPCFYCSVGFRAELVDAVAPRERRRAYEAADGNRLEAEPGLGADIGYVASVAAAYALALLDPQGSRGDLCRADRSFALVHGGSRPRGPYAELFRSPFDLLHPRVRRPDPCPVCGWKD